MNFKINPKRVLLCLFVAIGLLFIAQIGVIYLELSQAEGIYRKIIKLFDLSAERNIPTFFSVLLLFTSGVLLICIALYRKHKKMSYLYWLCLASIFFFLSTDEMISIHEQLRDPIHETFNTTGLLYYAWFIPYAIIAGLVGILYIRFLQRLPKHITSRIILAALVYGIGAIGLEAMGGWYHELVGNNENLTYYMISTAEEIMEMIGAALFVYAFLRYIEHQYRGVHVSLETEDRYYDFRIGELVEDPNKASQQTVSS